MIRFKESVRLHPDTLKKPQVLRILEVADASAPSGYDPTVTSACDSLDEHKPNSKHRTGDAFDFRTRDFPEGASVQTWLRRIIQALGPQYFVQIESDHIHAQWNGV